MELSSGLLGITQQMIASDIHEKLAVLVPARVITPPEATAPEQADPAPAIPRPNVAEGPSTQLPTYVGDVHPQWLAQLEYLQKDYRTFNNSPAHRYTDSIKCRVFINIFARAAHSRKHRKIELSLFSIHQKEGEPLKEYLQRFNTAALEVPTATQEVKANAFAQGLLDGDFFKSLAKKPATKFDALLARAAKYVNMEDAQVSKSEGR
ncbi:UNVERIFIED_CONTAM: hypothetical protein Scaly_1644700 [Sesamum calycinum]|uniref:Retrotransposon gag domain-containing protein n=1 Tax=Sesamum calycinum TaxID=2727403 RepID=A0AAW2P8W3_9LAMI